MFSLKNPLTTCNSKFECALKVDCTEKTMVNSIRFLRKAIGEARLCNQ
jgi:hypothetical protein